MCPLWRALGRAARRTAAHKVMVLYSPGSFKEIQGNLRNPKEIRQKLQAEMLGFLVFLVFLVFLLFLHGALNSPSSLF